MGARLSRMCAVSEDKWLTWLPFGLLGLATIVSTAAAPTLGDAAADVRWTLALTAVTAVWMLATPRPGPVNYTGRTALAFVLTWMNPFYAIFGVAGFFDVYDVPEGPVGLRRDAGRGHHPGRVAVGRLPTR